MKKKEKFRELGELIESKNRRNKQVNNLSKSLEGYTETIFKK